MELKMKFFGKSFIYADFRDYRCHVKSLFGLQRLLFLHPSETFLN